VRLSELFFQVFDFAKMGYNVCPNRLIFAVSHLQNSWGLMIINRIYATFQAGVVRPIPLRSGVRLQLSVVVASRRCERLTQAVLGKAFAGKL
jgi:hypothetical protein